MFVVTQFPFTDLRGFISQPTGRLGRPTWPIATVGKDFVRSTGSVLARPRGGVAHWAGEDIYGDASSALKFPDRLRKHLLRVNQGVGNIDFAFRRFFVDFHVNLTPLS